MQIKSHNSDETHSIYQLSSSHDHKTQATQTY